MKYVDYSIKLSLYRQFCCPVSLISALSSANIPVSPPRFFGEFDMLTFTARQFEKVLLTPSSRQPTRKPPKAALKPLGRPSFRGYGYELVRTLHDGLPYVEGRRVTD